MKDELTNNLRISDLPEPVRSYAKAVGLENLRRLARQSGGKNLYIPTEECLDKYGLKRRILEERRAGAGIRELSERFGLSVTTIYRYLKG